MDTTVFCQGCLATKKLVLFSCSSSEGENNFQKTFKMCFNLKVGFNTSQLEWICKECIENLNNAMEFKNRVEKTQTYLVDHFSERYKIFDSRLEVKQEDVKNIELEVDGFFDDNTELLNDVSFSDDIKIEMKDDTSFHDKKKRKKIKEKSVKKPPQQKPRKTKPKKERRWSLEGEMKPPKSKTDCKICHEVFANEHLLAVHRLNAHSARANAPEFAVMLACHFCSYAFAQVSELNDHLVLHHGCTPQKVMWESRNYVPCSVCGFFFRDFSIRSYHALIVHQLKEIPIEMLEKCTECDETFSNHQQQNVHMYNAHKKRIKLPQGGLNLTCIICDMDIPKAFMYKRHMREFHTVEGGLYTTENKCKYCGIYFESIPHWRNHLSVHGEPKKRKTIPIDSGPREYSYRCRKCPETFPLKSLRKKHMEDVHGFKDTLPCEVCGQELSSITALNKHLKIHTKEITAVCDYCGYGVKDKFDLTAHFAKHYETKPFKCETCFKEFKRAGNLRQHKKIHYAKQFTCSLCGLQFTHKYNMKSHMTRNHNQSFLTPVL